MSVRASGVNFRDVMTVLGMYPGEPLPLGLEAAGVVTEVGRGVDGFAVGDRVMGLCEGGFASEVVVDHRMWSRFPGSWSFAEAATVPVTFLTAWYGLRDLGRLVEGESVLVHSAAGGVGMAAVQLAREWGAVVYGTCGPVKRGFVEALGVAPERVASSRDTGFAERFGRVDVVLNSLAGEFVDASRGLLGEGGRFVEMGKTDLRDPGEFPGVEYRSFDLLEAGPVRIREMFTELLPLFEDGSLTPLPVSTWDIRRCSEALRFMSQARHVGKIVVTVPRAFDPDAPVLVTGGTGGVGAHLVRHLVSAWGARHVVVASRRGLDAPGAADLVADHDGAVTVTACDVTDQDSLTALLGAHPDLQGVVHAAGTVDDGVLGSLTADRVRALLAPKADAAELLDQATRTHDLSFFVGFSSSAGVLGAPGQAGYASANATLDAVALRRRQRGLPGQSLAWGLWADTGMAGDLTDTDRRRLAEQGFPPLTADQALGLFDQATRRPEALLVPLRVDPRRLGAAAPPLLRDLAGPVRRTATTTAPAPDTSTLVRQLAGLSPAEAAERLTELAVDRASAVLGHDGTRRVQPDEAFADLGFDSLLAVEFRNGLNAATGLTLPATVTFDHPTPRAVGRALLAELDLDGVPSTSALLAQLDRIDAAVDALGADESGRAALAARLHALAERLTTPDTEAGAAGAVGVGDRIADASADELADLLSEEFGIS
ncbi:NADPH:quinone reductase [Actinoalloteichus cyanogriseus DSM 43889]|uniref:NADPH:quinone reductase n=1 Tax=Actinoalloteichus caeruleus DSM 43889 TaxID=1120930 RepID=A0ABT1JET9_ACTCY|nr:NADPH:quinone reductase [Actinoalloteichus caeruleus DSM 43889]